MSRRKTVMGFALVAAVCVFSVSCDNAAPTSPNVSTQASVGGEGGSSSAASGAKIASVPPNLQGRFEQLPPKLQRRYLALPERAQKKIASLPEATIDKIMARILKRQSRRHQGQAGVVAMTQPDAVFSTQPSADMNGLIRGKPPLTVTFNMCKSTDPDVGDELKGIYDFDGDGKVDYAGPCRAEHTYEYGEHKAIVCLHDRTTTSEKVCKTYTIRTPGRQVAEAGCTSILEGSEALPANDWFAHTAFFDVAAAQGVTMDSSSTGGTIYTYFGCGPSFWGYRSAYTDVYYGYYSGLYTAGYAGTPAPASYAGCYTYAYATTYYTYTGGTQNYKTAVCDPGAF